MREEVHDLMTIGHVDAARQAYVGLWETFLVTTFIFGIDKFVGFLGTNYGAYVAGWVHRILPGAASTEMMVLGVIEVLLAIAVALAPRMGGDLLALYLVLAACSVFTIGG